MDDICKECGQKKQTVTISGRTIRQRCECELTLYEAQLKEKKAEETDQYLIRAGFRTGRYADMTLGSWVSRRGFSGVEKAAYAYIESVSDRGRNWLYLCGGFGTGKTHIAVAAARQLAFDKGWKPVLCRWAEHCSTVQQSWSERIATQWRDIHQAQFLVLDDIDKRSATEWAIGQLYELIEHRYSFLKPTIITANRKLSELPAIWAHDVRVAEVGKAIISRIVGQIQAQIEFKGDDYRFGK